MQTYYVAFNDSTAPKRAVRANNIDNLRKNLAKRLRVSQICQVYADSGAYIGGMVKMHNGRAGSQLWPKYMWVSNGKDYELDATSGTIRPLDEYIKKTKSRRY